MSYLASKPLTELRGMAAWLGIRFEFSWDKPRLEKEINTRCEVKPLKRPPLPIESEKKRSQVLMSEMSEVVIDRELEPYAEHGLGWQIFPTTVHLVYTQKRYDTITRRAPIAQLIECARRLING
jgi:hypothetical protein